MRVFTLSRFAIPITSPKETSLTAHFHVIQSEGEVRSIRRICPAFRAFEADC
jgi:hypothetical protein